MTPPAARRPISAREISTIAIFIALTAVLAQVSVPLPFTPIPFSLGIIAVYMTGMLLRPRAAALAQLGYLLLGAVGVPVFGGFRGGLMALIGPTGGYLAVYPLMAWIVSVAVNGKARRGPARLYLRAATSICLAHLCLYVGGTAWLSASTGTSFGASLALAVYPFVLIDLVKIAFCVVAVVPFRGRLIRMRLLQVQ